MRPPLTGNPFLEERLRLPLARRGDPDREALVARYAYGIPGADALAAIAAFAPNGIVELGAGTGYWAHLLAQHDVDVVAYDKAPPARTYHPVAAGDERAVEAHADRTLLLVWPTCNETWPGDAAARFHASGGTRLVFVGEGPGGMTGDATLHALLGTYGACLACTYGVDEPCVCAVEPLWQAVETIAVPQWDGVDDACTLHLRRDAVPRSGRSSRRTRRA